MIQQAALASPHERPGGDLTKRSDEELGRLSIEAAEDNPVDRPTSPEEDAATLAALNHMMGDLPDQVRAASGWRQGRSG